MNIIIHSGQSSWFGGRTSKKITVGQIGTTIRIRVFLEHFKNRRIKRNILVESIEEDGSAFHGTIVE